MHAVVINLARDTQRWDNVRAQLAAALLAAQRVEALDGSRLSPQALARWCDPQRNRNQYRKPLRSGEVGCCASHIGV